MLTIRYVLYTILLCIVVDGILYSQSRYGDVNILLASPQASLTQAGVDAMASGGAAAAELGLATSAIANPATMRFTKITAYAEFGKYTKSDWMGLFDYNGQYLAPSFVSFGLPLGEFNLSAGYFRQYSQRFTSLLPITTEAQPDGTGEFFEYERKVDVRSFFGATSVSLGDVVSLGITVGLNYFRYDEGIGNISVAGKSVGGLFIVGALFNFDDNVRLGTSFRYNSKMTFTPDINSGKLLTVIGTSDVLRRNSFYSLGETPSYRVNLPPILELGASWQVVPELQLLVGAEFQNWTSSSIGDAVNRWNVHFGAAIDPIDFVSLRIGFFTLNNPYESNENVLNQSFITAGVQVKSDPIAFWVGVMDSHAFKKSGGPTALGFSEPFDQTYFSSGISVCF